MAHHIPANPATPAAVPVECAPASNPPSGPPPDAHYQFPAYHQPVFPGQHPPLPVLTSQCPYSRNVSYSSLAHQGHAPSAAPYPHPPHSGYAPPAPPPYSPYAPLPPPHASHADYYKTKADIYREIVNECEEFERSTTVRESVSDREYGSVFSPPPLTSRYVII